MMSNDPAHFDLWTNTYSLCSTMIRYTIAVRGDPEPGSVPITVEEHELDIVEKMEQLDEHFLLGVNAKGQVRYSLLYSSFGIDNSNPIASKLLSI
jgi:hypothetical protein